MLFFYYKKIIAVGKENIPKRGAVLFVANHKNALIDPLLVGIISPRDIHFLTRASAFKIKFVKWILGTVNMMPIYRMRDGKEALAKNEEIFQQCFSILKREKCLLIFPEGTHDLRRWVRPLSKGFTRIVFGFLEEHPETDLHIVPVGLNYTEATKFAESVSVYFGKSILANSFYDKNDINTSTNTLKDTVTAEMKKLTAHVPIDHYEEIIQKLGNVNFLDPKEANQRIIEVENGNSFEESPKEPSNLWKIGKGLFYINSIIPIQIYNLIKPKIKEEEFISTTKFAIGATAFPLFYMLQIIAVNHFFSITSALLYGVFSVLLALFVAKTK
ncbi:MAG: lysophospholipid acyltransferase family protein [Flavobacteriaceae bacterium]